MVLKRFTATTIAQLNGDIAMANAAPTGSGAPDTYEIDIKGTIAETEAITKIAVPSGVRLIINGIRVGSTGAAVNGSGGSYGGFFVQSGNVTIQNLLIENTTAQGGSGGVGSSSGISPNGGGGGLGAGGGLFVASGATATLRNVSFTGTRAFGGGVSGISTTGGSLNGGSGSGFGSGGQGGTTGTGTGTGTGIATDGGFGAGGGGSSAGSSRGTGGPGGLGGFGGSSGFRGGVGTGGPGGVGAGMGGAVFVQSGGTLVVAGSGGESGAGASGGSGFSVRGQSFGQGYYLQGSGTSLTFAPGAGQTITIANEIADDTGAAAAASYTGASSYTRGSGSLVLNAGTADDGVAAGILRLSSSNHYVGGTTILSGILDLAVAGAGGGGAITFAGSSSAPATLMLESAAQSPGTAPFANTLRSFGANASLDLVGLSYTTGGDATPLILSGNTLTVAENGRTETFMLADIPAGTSYYAHQDAAGTGTLVDTLCFAAGTAIRTTRGDVVVEALRVGDLVVTASGACRPIRWLGHRTIDRRRHPRPHEAMPVRIAAHAFGASRPARELRLSPGHPVLVGADASGEGGHLVPIMCLINGTTIERTAADDVTYWHIELDQHDILLAEGLPAESYIDLGSRPWFDGADGALYDPDLALPALTGRCRPVAIDGPIVEAERGRLDMIFAARLAAACAWPATQDISLAI